MATTTTTTPELPVPLGRIKYHDDSPDLDFEEALGYVQGVAAYSNIDDCYFSGESNFLYGMYTGYKYQCVEYARRFLLVTKGVTFTECRRASEIFDKDEVEDVVTGDKFKFVACANGETTVKPAVGMVLIYPFVPGPLPWGHVAIIGAVGDDWVGIAEQNQANKSWEGKPYGRTAKLVQDPETKAWSIVETLPETDIRPCRGWMYVEGRADRPALAGEGHRVEYGELTVQDKFRAARSIPTLSRWPIPPAEADPANAGGAAAEAVLATRKPRRELAGGVPAPGDFWPGPTREVQSLWEPSESATISQIPSTIRSFRLIGEAHKALVSRMSDEEVASKYATPLRFVEAARRQLADFRHGSLMGAMVLNFEPDSADGQLWPFKLAESRLDGMDNYADFSLAADAVNRHGMPFGWKMTTTNDDFNRAVKLVAQRKHQLERRTEDINTVVFVLDANDGELLPLDALLPADLAARVTAERVHLDYAIMQYEKNLVAKKEGLASGEVSAADAPVACFKRVSLHDANLAIDAAAGVITYAGHRVDLVWKVGPWSAFFALLESGAAKGAAGFGKFQQLMDFVAADHHVVPTVFQPLWAHMLDSRVTPTVVRDAVAWLRSDAAPAAIASYCHYVAPSLESFDAETGAFIGAIHTCTAPAGPIKKRFRALVKADEPADVVSVCLLAFAYDGLSAMAGPLEAWRQPGEGDAKLRPVRLSDVVHPASMAMNFMGQNFAEDEDEQKEEAEASKADA